jgi:hypothetical protein
MMRRIYLILPILLAFIGASAQYDEIGGFVGSAFKIDKKLRRTSMAYELIYRHSLNSRQAVSGTLTVAGKALEVAGRYEINYLNFFLGSTKNYYTTYIFGGLSLLVPYSEKTSARWPVALPFGLGFKYSVGKSIGLAVEAGLRKDLGIGKGVEFLEPNLTYYGFAGLAVTYKFSFVNKRKCRNLEF